jgi:hypothetical protein
LQKIEILFKQKGIDNPEKERKAKMSNQMSMQKQSIAKPFCKVCHDAGKTVAEYSTHYVRESRGGAVVCPTILNQQCKYCKKHGHTPSHCPALQAKQVQAKQVQAKPIQAKQVQAKQVQAQAQARLCEPPRIENKISAPVIKPVALKMNSWASVVGKKPGQAQEEQAQEEQAQEEPEEEQAQEEPEEEQAKAPEEEQAQRVPEEQAQEQAQRVPEQAQRVPEAQAQAQEQAQRVPEEQAPAFNYSNMNWADVE